MAEKTVLVPVDDGPLSNDALEHALERNPDAEIVAVHAVDPADAGRFVAPGAGVPSEPYWNEMVEAAEERAETVLDDARELAAAHDREIRTELDHSQPVRAVVERAESEDADEIVVGSHGRTGVSRVLLGSVAEGVVRRAPCPVTVVR